MKKIASPLRYALALAMLSALCAPTYTAALAQSATATPAKAKVGMLDREQAAAIMPTSVYYKGQSAPVQGRNSAGIRFPDGSLALMALVDTSGYSSAIQQSYQGYLLNEVHLKIGDKVLAPGAYGFGFVAGDRVVVMDIAGNEILHATTTRDEHMARPNPLQIIPDAAAPGTYRLYLGRSYVTLSSAK